MINPITQLGQKLFTNKIYENSGNPLASSLLTKWHSVEKDVDWIRGPRSIGALLEKVGFQAVPSPRLPHPDGKKFWSGGYITRHYRKNGMRTLQFEHPWSVRKKEGRATSVPALAEAIDELMEETSEDQVIH